MLLIVILIILAVIVLANVRTVHQGHVQIVERLGKFHDAWGAGLHVKVPFIDAVRKDVSLKEQTYDFPESQMITKDNIVIVVDSVVYSKVFDAQKYYYGIEDPVFGIENLTTTTLRSIVGSKNFDELLNGRDAINAQLKQEIDSATDPWGISITRVEVKKLQASREVQETMQKEMTAERNKRATILDAEAHQKSIITAAEGDKKAAINEKYFYHTYGVAVRAIHNTQNTPCPRSSPLSSFLCEEPTGRSREARRGIIVAGYVNG